MKLTYNDIRYVVSEATRRVIEGAEWSQGVAWGGSTRGRKNTANLTINQDKTDKGNIRGDLNTDTRMFGSKSDILYGDGTMRKTYVPLAQKANHYSLLYKFYQEVLDYCDGKIEVSDIDFNNAPQKQSAFIKIFMQEHSIEELKSEILSRMSRESMDSTVKQMTYDRVQGNNSEKIKRYNIGIVPGTNVKFIALYTMNDFNFNDAIKHGKVRPNDKIKNITGLETKKGTHIPVSYDNNNVVADVESNFSLKGVRSQHYKTQYGLGDKQSYTSIHQFIDKSIMYAASALKDENFIPDYIIAPPSSSNFNRFYCTNLSRKIGCEFVDNFFKKGLFQVKIMGGQDTDVMKKHGFTDEGIFKFEQKVKNSVFQQISYDIRTPIEQFVTKPIYKKVIENAIQIYPQLKKKKYTDIVDMIIDDILCMSIDYIRDKRIAQDIINKALETYDYKGMLGIIKNQRNYSEIIKLCNNIARLLEQYSKILIDRGGFKLRDVRGVKITDFEKRERDFLDDCYVVADKELSQNGGLLKRYKDKKILIFDEDINSGGTLRMAINALTEQTGDPSNNGVMCLCNAYSKGGY